MVCTAEGGGGGGAGGRRLVVVSHLANALWSASS